MSIVSSTPTKPHPAAMSRAVSPDSRYQFMVSLVTWLVIVVSLSAVVFTTWVSFAG